MGGRPWAIGTRAHPAGNEPPHQRVVEAVGGGVGGLVGSLLPDLLEPAISSWHRSVAHSWTTASVGVATIPYRIDGWQERCRVQAELHKKSQLQATDAWSQTWHVACVLFWLLLSGFVVGVLAGYA